MTQPSKQEMPPNRKKRKLGGSADAYVKYSGMAIQMGATIAIFTYGGQLLDGRFNTNKPYWTIGFSLLGVFVSLYSLLKGVLADSKQSSSKKKKLKRDETNK